MTFRYSRRQALWLSGGLLVACHDRRATPDASAPLAPPSPLPAPPAPQPAAYGSTILATSTPGCVETHDNIEGPYYRAGAPERADLAPHGTPGTPLVIEGRVTGPDCSKGQGDLREPVPRESRGLAAVELDVWHATHDGHYDNDGTMRLRASEFLLRGRIKTDADGRYQVKTIVPGRYLNGRQYRPAHVHVKVRAPGFAPLTTQLYFPGDPYNDVDPFIHKSLVMGMEKSGAGMRGHFDFVLRSV